MEEQNVYDSFRDSVQRKNLELYLLVGKYLITYFKISFVTTYFFALITLVYKAGNAMRALYEIIFVMPSILAVRMPGTPFIGTILSTHMRHMALQLVGVYLYYLTFKVVSYYTYSAVEEAFYYLARYIYWYPKGSRSNPQPQQDQAPKSPGSPFYPPFGSMREVPEE